jgi:heme/copper-type cytochrome/quinol oxidase subunit 2
MALEPLPTVMLADAGGIILAPVFLLVLAFWLWMLVDCASHEKPGSTKIAWLLIILFLGVIGAPLYFFLRKFPRRRQTHYQPPPWVYQPWRQR